MAGRTIAIGDIHGCLAALDALLEVIEPQGDDQMIVLGDFVDRGPDSRGVIERLFELRSRVRLLVLMGNHEEMLLLARDDELELAAWLEFGGAQTLASYGVSHPRDLPKEHVGFLRSNLDFVETERHLFVHANYLPDLPLEEQPADALRWESLWQRVPAPHASGKTAIVGHTAQHEGRIWGLGHLICIDTYCHGGGWLTALDVVSGRYWQADREGGLGLLDEPL